MLVRFPVALAHLGELVAATEAWLNDGKVLLKKVNGNVIGDLEEVLGRMARLGGVAGEMRFGRNDEENQTIYCMCQMPEVRILI